jgi:superfamily II DNA or RNA helicase
MILADLIDDFADGVRRRGADYFKWGAVRITAQSPEVLRAAVAGTKSYEVTFEVRRNRLAIWCSCPYFDSDGPCKHLWATALAADKSGALQRMREWDEIEEAPSGQALAASDEAADAQRGVRAERDPPPSHLRLPAAPTAYRESVRAHPASTPTPIWKTLLDEAQAQNPRTTSAPATPTKQILYVLDVQKTASGELTLLLLERMPKKDGQWTKEKMARIPVEALATLADEADRRILPLLEAAHSLGGQGYYSSYAYASGGRCFTAEIRLPAAMANMIVPLIATTGRLHIRESSSEPMRPASCDAGEPWDFVLRFERRDDGSGVDLTGALRRGAETVDLSAPLLLTPSGWVLWKESVGRFRHSNAFGLLATLRQLHRIPVPARDERAALEALFAAETLPPLDLPEDLRLRELTVAAGPRLRIGPPERRAWLSSGDRPTAELSFSYEGHTIGADDRRAVLALVDERQLIRRDRAAEEAAAAKLRVLGFRSAGPRLDISPKKLPAAVHTLVAEGWQVEAEGRLYRKPGAFRLSVSSGIDWFDLMATVDFDGQQASLPDLLRALRKGEKTVPLGDGSLGLLPEEWLAKYGLLADVGTVQDDRVRFRKTQAGFLDALVAAEPAVSVDRAFARAREAMVGWQGVAAERAPKGFRGQLRPYQEVGLGWLSFLRRFGFGGCLADDMGLGKTVQVLAMLEARRVKAARTSLAVVPKSLIWNWQQEAARFAPKLQVISHTGPERAQDAEHLTNADLVLTTYGTLRADVALLRGIEFDYIILDEAQAIKNKDSESAKAARLLRGEHRLALSGTPIENHIGELWSLFEFLNPGMLGTARAFDGITGASRPTADARALIARAVRPFILRRSKEEVAPELPPKHEETILCELESPQRRLYNELRAHYRTNLLGRLDRDGLKKSKIQVLEALLRLRQAACHPGLIDKKRASEPCAKLDVLLPRLLEVRAEGHKALVFSQFTSFLALVRARLDASQIPYQYLDGDVDDRQARVARFQSDPDCSLFLISLKAGGVGLNLTAADYVFILDPWWNPAVEAQAVDRAHRIGQTKRVFVYRLLCRDTVEEKVAALQESKRGIAESIITASTSLIRELDRETLEMLLS